MKATFLAVRAYQRYWRGKKHIQIKPGNTKTISYVNNIEGIVSEKCNDLSKQIWDVCISENIWISAVHIPGKQNTIANFMSRSLNENTEWQLSPAVYKKIVRTFYFEPEIDLFASYLNYQVENYISWFLDPKASIMDAFSIDWTNKKFHAFPPFSLIGATLPKI